MLLWYCIVVLIQKNIICVFREFNTIRIRIRSFLESRIIFVFVFGHQNTIRSPLLWIHLFSTVDYLQSWVLFLRRLVVMSELTLRPPMGFPNTDRPLLQMDHQEYKWNLWKKSEIQIVFQNQCVTRFSTLGKPHSFAFDCIYISVFQYNWQKNWQSSS